MNGSPPIAVARRREGFTHEVEARTHTLVADEPTENGGADAGPRPSELLASALASCTAITVELYAERKGWELGAVEVAVAASGAPAEGTRFDVRVSIPERLDTEQLSRIETIASKCPVARTLTSGGNEVVDTVEAPDAPS